MCNGTTKQGIVENGKYWFVELSFLDKRDHMRSFFKL